MVSTICLKWILSVETRNHTNRNLAKNCSVDIFSSYVFIKTGIFSLFSQKGGQSKNIVVFIMDGIVRGPKT